MLRVFLCVGFVLTGCAAPQAIYYVQPTGEILKDDGQSFEIVTEIPEGAETVHISAENIIGARDVPRQKQIDCITDTDLFGVTRTKCDVTE